MRVPEMGRLAAVLLLIAAVVVIILALEWLGVVAAIIALIGLIAFVILVFAAVVVAIAALLSIPYFFVAKRMQVREGSFTLDRLKDEKD